MGWCSSGWHLMWVKDITVNNIHSQGWDWRDEGVIFLCVRIHPNLLWPRHTTASPSTVSAHFGEGVSPLHSHASWQHLSWSLWQSAPQTGEQTLIQNPSWSCQTRSALASMAWSTCIFSRHWVRYEAYCTWPAQKKYFIMCVMREKVIMCLPAHSNWWMWSVGRMKLSTLSASRMKMHSVQVGHCCICSNVFGPIHRNHFKSAADTLRTYHWTCLSAHHMLQPHAFPVLNLASVLQCSWRMTV